MWNVINYAGLVCYVAMGYRKIGDMATSYYTTQCSSIIAQAPGRNIYNKSVRTSKKTQYLAITNINWLILFK